MPTSPLKVFVDPISGELEVEPGGTGGGGGGGTCANSPQLLCLGGRTGTTNNPTISSDADGTIRGSGAAGFQLNLGSDTGTPGVHIQRNAFGVDRLLVGAGPDPTSMLAPGGALQFVITNDDPTVLGASAALGCFSANDVGGSPLFLGVRGRGTLAAPTETQAGDTLLQFLGQGYDNTNTLIFSPPAAVLSFAQSAPSGTGFVPGNIGFSTCDFAGNFAERMSIDGNGHFLVDNISTSSDTTLQIGNGIRLQLAANTIAPTNLFGGSPAPPYWPQVVSLNQDLMIDSTLQPVIWSMYQMGGAAHLPGKATWDVIGDNGFKAFFGIHMGANIRSRVSGNQSILGLGATMEMSPEITARGPNVTAGDFDVGLRPFFSDPVFIASDVGADLTITYSGGGIHTIGLDSNVTVLNDIGWEYRAPTVLAGSPTVTEGTGFFANDTLTDPPAGMWSLFANGTGRTLGHAGPGVFGTAGGATNASVGLEVQSTTRAFLVSRMTTTQKNALTAVNGMIVYDTTLDKLQGFQAGSWQNLI